MYLKIDILRDKFLKNECQISFDENKTFQGIGRKYEEECGKNRI